MPFQQNGLAPHSDTLKTQLQTKRSQQNLNSRNLNLAAQAQQHLVHLLLQEARYSSVVLRPTRPHKTCIARSPPPTRAVPTSMQQTATRPAAPHTNGVHNWVTRLPKTCGTLPILTPARILCAFPSRPGSGRPPPEHKAAKDCIAVTILCNLRQSSHSRTYPAAGFKSGGPGRQGSARPCAGRAGRPRRSALPLLGPSCQGRAAWVG